MFEHFRLNLTRLSLVVAILCLATPPAVLAQNDQSSSLEDGGTDASNASRNESEEIAQLIEQLGHPSYRMRSQAEWALQQYGLAAFEQLLAAVNSPKGSVDIANAANYIINSQDVVWYIETDSVDVRGYLKDYDQAQPNQRIARIKMLAEIPTA